MISYGDSVSKDKNGVKFADFTSQRRHCFAQSVA
jgi:hypothetical protein